MLNDRHASPHYRAGVDPEADLKEIVMGLHWHPPKNGVVRDELPANLDARCVLFDGQHEVLEVVDPGRPCNANGSVVHTGDSRTGASEWDDERIFVFLDALPVAVSALSFFVTSPDGRLLREVPGASCHVSDRVTEFEWVRLELAGAGDTREFGVATLRRCPRGWEIIPGTPGINGGS